MTMIYKLCRGGLAGLNSMIQLSWDLESLYTLHRIHMLSASIVPLMS